MAPLRRYSVALFSCLFLLASSPALADGRIAYWISLRSNLSIDRQVAEQIGENSGMIVLRGNDNGALPDRYSYANTIARLKAGAPGTPVLLYSLVTRIENRGHMDRMMLEGLDLGSPIAIANEDENGEVKYLNILDPQVRKRITSKLLQEAERFKADGIAVDGAVRRPVYRPAAIAQVCARQADLCDQYAQAMDAIIHDLNVGLPDRKTLLINGLRNYQPGLLEDQIRLAEQADAAIIEYFGLYPGRGGKTFSQSIQPYLDTLKLLPENKPVLFFGRAPKTYTSYVDDYLWQRYLYTSFLLGARSVDLFKYHATFQVPTTEGRSGGLDMYSDWDIPLGKAVGAAKYGDGLAFRRYENGLVAVAPNDGKGGRIDLPQTYFTPEGERVSGNVRLAPGHGLILLKTPPASRPASHTISARSVADWKWAQASFDPTADGGTLRLEALPAELAGEHDIRLDYHRSLAPYQQLAIRYKTRDASSAIYAVAEIDDPRGENTWLVVRVGGGSETGRSIDALEFRSRPKKDASTWPMINVAADMKSSMSEIVLDGPDIARQAGYTFRRWSHVRLGPLDLSQITLDAPRPLPARSSGK